MPEKKSLLDQIDAESQLKDGDSPFKRKEKTKPLRVRESFYNDIRKIALEENTKMVEILDDIIKRGLRSYKKSHPDTDYK